MPGPVSGGLSIRGLTLVRGERVLVRDLDWDIRPGVVAFVSGENGSGKSTLLAALAGRATPARGRILRSWPVGPHGKELVRYHPDMAPPGEVRVRDWMRLVAALVPPPPHRVPAPPLAPELPPGCRLGDLSTGERKRLVLQALLGRAAGAYVLDEPFQHLSPAAARILAAHLEGLAHKAVVVVATHRDTGRPAGAAALRLLGGGAWRLEKRPPEGGA